MSFLLFTSHHNHQMLNILRALKMLSFQYSKYQPFYRITFSLIFTVQHMLTFQMALFIFNLAQ